VIEAQFLGNRESRVLQLNSKFHVFKQGNLSVSDYCHRMKGMANDLRALGETVTDRHLVLNLLHGLNKRFNHMKIFIKRSQSFLSFHTILNDLKLEERSSWTTQWPRDRPPRSTPCPQEEGVLCSSCCPVATATGIVVSSSDPSPSCPQPQ
jgi:hypothetical protein